MVSKKLGWIKRRLGDFGNKLFYRKSEKMNLFIVTSIVQSVIEEYRNIYEGDLPKALKELAKGSETGAGEIVSDLIENPIMFGISLKFLLSKHLPDVGLQIWWTLLSILGNDAKKIFGKPKFIPATEAEDGITKIVIALKQCMMCSTKLNIAPEDLGDQDYFHVITSIAEAAVQHMQDYVENDYKIKCKETKCFLRGDDQGELTLFFYPKDESSS
ncbi:MAG: hypothetical protein EAX96_16045 [Candidatus Lokiarchaeota archaeon]|nr:hypothetical protein [Candidatus Lokiarchaeota archaeon]